MNRLTKRALTIAAVVVVTATAGVAFAAWTVSGTGTGSAASTTSINATITPGANPANSLFPGATKTFSVTFANPNPFPVQVTSIAPSTADLATGDATHTGCTASNVTSALVSSPSGTIAANNGTGSYDIQVTMAFATPDNCQNNTFRLPLTAQLLQVP